MTHTNMKENKYKLECLPARCGGHEVIYYFYNISTYILGKKYKTQLQIPLNQLHKLIGQQICAYIIFII